jgi:hypothetical protein
MVNFGGSPHDSDDIQDLWYALKEAGFTDANGENPSISIDDGGNTLSVEFDEPVSIDDNADSITIDTDDGPVDITTSGAITVDDNGGSITVDTDATELDIVVQDVIDALEQADDISILDEVHRELHKGNSYLVSRTKTEIAHAEEYVVYIDNPAGSGVISEFSNIQFQSEGKTEINIYEGVTIDTTGTPITPVNNRIGAPNNSVTGVQLDPDWSGGTLRANEITLTSDLFSPGSAKGETVSPALDEDTNILIQIVNMSGATADMDIEMDWIELDADDYPAVTQS